MILSRDNFTTQTFSQVVAKARDFEDGLRTESGISQRQLEESFNKVSLSKPTDPSVHPASGTTSCVWCGRSSHPRSDCPAKNHSCQGCGKRGHWKLVCKSLASAKSVNGQPCPIKPQQAFLSTSRYRQAPDFTPSNFKWTLAAPATQSTNLISGSSILVQSLPPMCVCSTTRNPSSPQRVKFCCHADTVINSMMLCSKLLHHQSTTLRCLVWPTALAWAYCSLKSTMFTN